MRFLEEVDDWTLETLGSMGSKSLKDQPSIRKDLDRIELDDDIDIHLTEDELCLQQKVNLVAMIASMRFKPT